MKGGVALPPAPFCLTAFSLVFDLRQPRCQCSTSRELLSEVKSASVAALFPRFCRPCGFGQVIDVLMLTDDWTAAVPDQPFFPPSRSVLQETKTIPRANTLPKTECGICSQRQQHQTFLQSSALLERPCQANGLQTI